MIECEHSVQFNINFHWFLFRLSLAYSHAKLSLRSEVTMDDALIAIKLYEETLTARFGKLRTRLGMSVTTQGGSGRQFVTGP